jgi:hypothetical protein
MKSSRAYQPDALDRMTIVLERATRELRLGGLPVSEKERLATCILSIGNTYQDVNRLLEKSIRMYMRTRRGANEVFPPQATGLTAFL